MSVIIISSKKDPASINIKNSLLKKSDWDEVDIFYKNPVLKNTQIKDIYLITINDNKIFHENIDTEIQNKINIKPKQAIFLSRHRSKMGKPSLTVHPIGNYNKAEFGGINQTLVKSSPNMMTTLLRNIKKNLPFTLKYQVCFEVTHHGPYLKIPTLFVEVGSTEKEWVKSEPAEIIAKSLLELLKKYRFEDDFSEEITVLVGVGGGHYAPRFTDIAFQKKIAFGHMIPNYQIDTDKFDFKIFENAIKNTPNISGIYIHRKSFKKSQVTQLKQIFKEANIDVFSSKDLIDLR